jgi:hypothetical protein
MPYVIGGRPVQLAPNEEPRNLNGPVYVPLRAVIEALGGSAEWNDQSSSVTANYNGHTVNVPGNSPQISVDGQNRQMSVSPFNQEGHIWVPVEIFEAFGTPAIADTNTNTVTVNA